MEFSTKLSDAVLKDGGFGEEVLNTIICFRSPGVKHSKYGGHEEALATLIRDEAKGELHLRDAPRLHEWRNRLFR